MDLKIEQSKEYSTITLSKVIYRDVIFGEFKDNLSVDLPIAKEIVADRLDFTENKKHYLIMDLSNVKQVSPHAKRYLKNPDAGIKNILGAALIASNPVSALIANIFVKMPKAFETKFFSNIDGALSWITEIRKKNISS
jgi:hypothetical protein